MRKDDCSSVPTIPVDQHYLPPDVPQLEEQGQQQPGTYERSRERLVGAWNDLRGRLFDAYLEEQAPPTSCHLCGKAADSRCLDCGPVVKFCQTCLHVVHNSPNTFLHVPEVIVVSTTIPLATIQTWSNHEH